MRVHITLDKETRSSETAKESAVTQLKQAAPLENVNEKRFDKYGVLSADVPPMSVEKLRQVTGVKSVEPDQVRHAL